MEKRPRTTKYSNNDNYYGCCYSRNTFTSYTSKIMVEEEFIDKMTAWGVDDINTATVYNYEDIINWWDTDLPSKFLLNTTPIQDQRQCKYGNGCTRYWGSHAINETNKQQTTTGASLRGFAVDNKLGNTKSGSSMTSFIQQVRNAGLINWYASLSKNNIQLIKQTLFNGKAIYTGSNRIDRKAMVQAKTKIAIIRSGIGHIFCLVGWDDELGVFILRDSFWPNYWGDGHFYIKYDDVWYLYTLIVFTTPDEHQNLQAIKDEKMLQLALSKKISNWQNLQSDITREQGAIMIGRLKYGLLEDSELLLKTQELGIWNGKRPQDKIIRSEMMLMFSRYLWFADNIDKLQEMWYMSIKNLENTVTRDQFLIVCWRSISQ